MCRHRGGLYGTGGCERGDADEYMSDKSDQSLISSQFICSYSVVSCFVEA